MSVYAVYPYHSTAKPHLTHVIRGNLPDGRRPRYYCRTKKEAEFKARRLNAEAARTGLLAVDLTDDQRIEAAECFRRLAGVGRTMRQAVAHYLDYLAVSERSSTVSEAVARLLDDKAREGVSKKHLTNLRYQLRPFDAVFGERKIATVQKRELQEFLHGRGLPPASFRAARTHLALLFNHAISDGAATVNPVDDIKLTKAAVSRPGILTPEGMRDLLGLVRAETPHFLAGILVQAFCGLRTEEAIRLDWAEVHLERGFLEVVAAKSKTGQRRLVDIPPGVVGLLRPVAGTGRVAPSDFRRWAKVFRARIPGGIPKNALRHSFASYHLSAYNDAAKTALLLGHTTTAILFAHYRELVTREAACDWWCLPAAASPSLDLKSCVDISRFESKVSG